MTKLCYSSVIIYPLCKEGGVNYSTVLTWFIQIDLEISSRVNSKSLSPIIYVFNKGKCIGVYIV